MLIRHIRLAAIAAGAVVAVLLLHAGQQSAAPGRFLTWSTASTPTPGGSIPTSSLLPSPTANAGSAGPLAGLRVPLQSMLRGLNADTAASASGEYGVLHTLSEALRQHVDSFLQWVTAGR